MKNVLPFAVLGLGTFLILAVVVTKGFSGAGLGLLSSNAKPVVPPASVNFLDNYLKARLSIKKTSHLKTALDFNINYNPTSQVNNIQGLEIVLQVTPSSFDLANSTISPDPSLIGAGMTFLQKSVRLNTQTGKVEIVLVGLRTQPKAVINFADTRTLASVHLAGTTDHQYHVTFDKVNTKIIYGNVIHVGLSPQDQTLTAD